MTNRRDFIKKAVYSPPTMSLIVAFPRPHPSTYGYIGSVHEITSDSQKYGDFCNQECQDYWNKVGYDFNRILTQVGGWIWTP